MGTTDRDPRERFEVAPLDATDPLPLLVRPGAEGISLDDLVAGPPGDWDDLLERHGAVLFRGFGVTDVGAFERCASALTREVFKENSEHQPITADGAVQVPVAYSADKQLLWHNENSFNREWPTRILFGCRRPADRGGETPLVDSRRVIERIAPDVRDRFLERGVMYVRNYHDRFGLSWQQVFRTEDRAQVEQTCAEGGFELEWTPDGRLRTRTVRPAAILHPRSGERSWFNQAQHWHVACLDDRTRRGLARLFDEPDYPRHCYYGDGTPIADADMRGILDVYRSLEIAFRWERGDVLAVDNLLTAHGRNPYSGPRELLVSLGDMLSYDQVQPAPPSHR